MLTQPISNGYMYILSLINPECHLEILKTPGVVEILKSPSGPRPVRDDQVENVRLLEKYVGACFFGTDFEVGDYVFVKEGPLTVLREVIDRLDSKKLHSHVNVIPGSVMINVGPNNFNCKKIWFIRWLLKDRIFFDRLTGFSASFICRMVA